MKTIYLTLCLLLASLSAAFAQQGNYWSCDYTHYENDMVVYFAVTENGSISANADRFEVAAFVNGECRGVAASNTKGIFTLRVWSNGFGEKVTFRIAENSWGKVLMDTTSLTDVIFSSDAVIGTPSAPHDFEIGSFKELEESWAVEQALMIDMSDWSFTTTARTIDGLRYYLDETNKLAEFIGFNYNSSSTELNIPAVVNYSEENYCVVAVINDYRYSQNNIKSVKLPKTIRKIGDYAFYYYTGLTYIEIPENVILMGNYVFYYSRNLNMIKVNATVPPELGSFYTGSSYMKITIPAESFHAYRTASVWNQYVLIGGDGVTVSTGKIAAGDLGHVVIDEATYLQEVNRLIIDEGTLNSDDWTTIESMSNLIEIDMSGVTLSAIPSSAFYGRWAMEKIVLPRNLQTIGERAFYNTGIKDITIPESVNAIDYQAFYNCDSLTEIIIPSSVRTLTSSCFYDCDRLMSVSLPDSLNSVKESAFYSCDNLSDVNFPKQLAEIGSSAFYGCPVKNIEFPKGITTINSSVFAYNKALEHLILPDNITTINSGAFYNCSALKDVKFNEGLKYIYNNAFYNCYSLKEVILPSSLEKCHDNPFSYCDNIKKFEVRAVLPPSTNGDCPMSGVDLAGVTLYVPTWSVGEYLLASGWSSFLTVEATDYMPQNIVVNKDFYFTLKDTLAADYRPNIYMTYSDVSSTDSYGYSNYERGNLTVSGRSKLAVNDFSFVVSPYAKYSSDRNVSGGYDYDNYRVSLNSTSLLVKGEMRAENVTLRLNNYKSRWQFVTFPFDVKVSDIVPQKNNTSWVIRAHNGAMRAAGKSDSVWVNLTADDVLEVGKGYIMHCYNPDQGDSYKYNGYSSYNTASNVWFDVSPIKNSVNRQKLFASGDVTIALEENLAEFDHNRSWNLIGNPYPCFYDTRFMDFNAPFMVWNSYNQNYVAYNPADDDYILSPGEAFFVQRPFDQESITFLKDGRQTDRYAREMAQEVAAIDMVSENAPARRIYNLTLTKDSLADRTRIVFNEKASAQYEIQCDAAKFASAEKSVPQIFTVSGNTRYAINERPFMSGDVQLGVYCGSDGEYSISIANDCEGNLVLEDKALGITSELSSTKNYIFNASAGECIDRFVLHFKNAPTALDEVGNPDDEDDLYNLQGIKVNDRKANGVYISKGQKTVVK